MKLILKTVSAIFLLSALACEGATPPTAPTVTAPEPTSNEPIAEPARVDASVVGVGLATTTVMVTHEDDVAIDAGPAPVIARRFGAYANLDPNDDDVVGPPEPFPDCENELKKAGISFARARLPVFTQKKSKLVCGAPEVVSYFGSASHISYNSPPLLTCGMALALASFERVVQEEASRVFHSKVTQIDQMGTYSCREVAAYPGTVSEHSYANAIDLMRFQLQNGKTVDILRDFEIAETPKKKEGEFLRTISRRANDEDIFSHVLTGFFNDAHKNHFHLDLARFRQDGTRPE